MRTVKDNWYILTGGPCSGKTTTLDALKKKGYKVVYEAARFLIDQEMKKGKTLQEIRKDELAFQRKVLEIKLEWEKSLTKNELTFFERGIPDSLAYYKLCGVSDDPFLKTALRNSFYKKVFLLEPLDYQKDYARVESEAERKQLGQLLEEAYQNIGVPVIRVLKMSLEKRVKFVLRNLQ
ncbi:MAG: ATP-binding protein [bacterium]|nr:ATP-binding protein [bacterium]